MDKQDDYDCCDEYSSIETQASTITEPVPRLTIKIPAALLENRPAKKPAKPDIKKETRPSKKARLTILVPESGCGGLDPQDGYLMKYLN